MSSIWLSACFANFRYGARVLVRSPGFTIAVVLTLGLAIGANSAMFSIVDAVVLRPLPYPESERLVTLTEIHPDGGETGVALGRLEDWNRLSSAFEAITGYYSSDVSDASGELPERVRMAVVTPRFQEVWGVAPALGPGLPTEIRRMGDAPKALLGDRYWHRRFGGETNLSKLSVRAEGQSGAVVGVMPASFQFPDRRVDLWSPVFMDAPWLTDRKPASAYWTAVGRLKPGVTLDQARADLLAVQARLAEQFPETDRALDVRIIPLKQMVLGDIGRSLWLLFAAVSIVLVIACANIAALLLARASARQRDLAVRFTLGASRAIVMAQLLAETALLAFAGALLGLAVASGITKSLARLAPEIPRVAEVRIGMQDIGYVLAAAAFVSLLCGLIPAIRSIRGEQSLSGTARTQFASRHSIQWILVGVQVALAVTLLTGAGVLLRSFDALSRVQPGFEPTGVLAFRVTGRWTESYNYDRVIQRINAWLDDLATLPGATSTATARWLPGVLSEAPPPVEFVQVGGAANDAMVAEGRSVDPRYFETMRIPLVSGQLCRKPSDNSMRLAKVEAMVNRAFAEQYFPGRQVLGVDLAGTAPQGFAPSETVAVVGVVENARESGLERAPVPTVYACDSAPNPFPWFLVRTAGSAETLAGIVRLKIHELQPLESVYDIAVLDRRIGEDYAQNRMRTWLLVIFASTALSLACVGVYGTLSYVVSQRRREVGLRVALGARSSSILAHFLAKVLRIVFLGCVAGLAIAFASAHLFSGILYGVSSTDPMTFSAVTLLVIAVATLAALVPAIRAASVEPMRVLRDD